MRGFLSSRPPSGSCRPRAVTGHREFPLLSDGVAFREDGCRIHMGTVAYHRVHPATHLPQLAGQDQTPKVERPTSTWCRWLSRTIIIAVPVEPGWLAHGRTGRKIQFDPAKGCESGADGACQVLLVRLWTEFLSNFLLHGTAILSCSDSQPAFQFILRFLHSAAGHDGDSIYDVT